MTRTRSFACIVGSETTHLLQTGKIVGKQLGGINTPYGKSGEILDIDNPDGPFYMLSRCPGGINRPAPCNINTRANLYALKELGVSAVLDWAPAGAVDHSIALGDLVLASDVVDLTSKRVDTFFPNSALGYLRQFPVFCRTLQRIVAQVLYDTHLPLRPASAVAVTEGPRLETPAEIRRIAGMGAQLVTHLLAPEVFLARELQMCYVGLLYVVNYAETGSKHTPFDTNSLFAGSDSQPTSRLDATRNQFDRVIREIATAVELALAEEHNAPCECAQPMTKQAQRYNLSENWKDWFDNKDQE
ncbi:MAG TPA: phosphorylase [Phycisphaerae bacterium]|nr:phosphorylase [Phycisphaerae bacterium]